MKVESNKVVFEEMERRGAMALPVAPKWLVELMLVVYGLVLSILAFNLGG